MLSDKENLDIMLGENHYSWNERNESIYSNQARRPRSVSGDELVNNGENNYLDAGSFGPNTSANHGQNSTGGNSSAEINRLSSELNSRLSRELDEMMSSVNTQIQRAISDAICGQILPQIQSVLNAGSGQSTLKKWNVPSERPGMNSEESYGEKAKKTIEVNSPLVTELVVNLIYALTTAIVWARLLPLDFLIKNDYESSDTSRYLRFE